MLYVLPVPISTPRLLLRLFERQDLQDWIALRDDPEVARFVSTPVPADRAESRFWQEMAAASHGEYAALAVCERDTERVIGQCVLQSYELDDFDESTAELVVVVRPESRGRGVGTEAAEAVIQAAWTLEGVERVVGRVAPGNHVSRSMVTRLRMQGRGTVPGGWDPSGPDELFVIERPRRRR